VVAGSALQRKQERGRSTGGSVRRERESAAGGSAEERECRNAESRERVPAEQAERESLQAGAELQQTNPGREKKI